MKTKENGLIESLGRYANLTVGPDSKNEVRFSDNSFDSPAMIPDWNGKPIILKGILARNSGFCSSLNLMEAFIVFVCVFLVC